ncbi:MAG TPA: methyltransferase domain-containing protein [Dyella sp.]|uniref:class I SAM-dependent methyltransferase n=1 Tax=Dyella sp. TaxID=1869338 RepID=UPI002F9579CA
MTHTDTHEQTIVDVWQGHAEPWTRAVREGRIESRRLVTDAAIVRAVLALAPHSALDIGCGEGWLARCLAEEGIRPTGVDMVPELIEAARAHGGDFRTLSYAELAQGALGDARFDVAVCNFSLLGKQSVDELLKAMPVLLHAGGSLVVQTLHPCAIAEGVYGDGWREGSWVGCGEGFGQAAPWYFRTFAGWQATFAAAGLFISGLDEPVHPHTGRPVSIVFTLRAHI